MRQVSESTTSVVERWFNFEDAAEVGEKSWDRGRGKERGCDGSRKWSFLRTEMDDSGVCIDIDLRER